MSGGTLAAGRRIDDAFAIVDVGVPGIDVFLDNRRVGRTDRSGRVLVAGLTAHQRNALRIDSSHLPVNAHVESSESTVVPTRRGGTTVRYRVEEDAKAAIVIFADVTGKPLKAGLRGTLGEGAGFVIGHDGRTWLRGLAAENTATVNLGDTTCQATFTYVPDGDRQITLGPVTCR
jgi:outer membrane usher protein